MTTSDDDEGALGSFLDRLDALVGDLEPDAAHWIDGADDGSYLCFACCDRIVGSHNRRKRRGGRWTVDGGWDALRSSETPIHCADCDGLLGFAFTAEGARDHLTAIAEHGPADLGHPEQAWKAVALLEALERWRPDLLGRAVAVFRAALPTGDARPDAPREPSAMPPPNHGGRPPSTGRAQPT